MTERLFGLETEYAAVPTEAIDDLRQIGPVVGRLVQQAETLLPGIADGGGRGRFLANGARFYVDTGQHPEWSTAEVANPWDAVRHVLAGERWLLRLAAGLWTDDGRPLLSLFKTNVDPTRRVAWSCHESVLYRNRDATEFGTRLTPYLVTRVIYTGAGGFDPFAPGLEFVMSPRAMFLQQATSNESRWDRGIVHLKQEPLCDHGFRRWHLICGESLNSEIAMWLRSATLVLGVSLIEGGVDLGDPVRLASPVEALHSLVRDPACRMPLAMAQGGPMSPLQIQRYYLEQAEAHVDADFMPPWAGTACRYWRAMVDQLESAPDSVAATLDWAIRRALFGRLLDRRGFTWERVSRWNEALRTLEQRLRARPEIEHGFDLALLVDPPEAVRAVMAGQQCQLARQGLEWAGLEDFVRVRREVLEADARFSELGDAGLFAQLDREGVLVHHVPGVDNIEHAMEHPPAVGRAAVRGAVIRRVQPVRQQFAGNWNHVANLVEHTCLDLSHPFETEERWHARPSASQSAGQADRRPAGIPPFVRRAHALDLLLRGDYIGAQTLLDELVLARYDPASTSCHAARLAIVRSNLDEARALAREAWALRGGARPYVVARTLWYRALFAMLDGEDSRPWLGRLKDYLSNSTERVEWIMQPVLDQIRPRLAPEGHALLTGLAGLLNSGGADGALEQFAAWREAGALPYRSTEAADAREDGQVA
jgi:proteasome accessory factor A